MQINKIANIMINRFTTTLKKNKKSTQHCYFSSAYNGKKI